MVCINSYSSCYIYVARGLNGTLPVSLATEMPIWQISAHESDRKTNFPTPCADNWRNVPENLLHDSWFLGLIRNSKRLQRGWVGGWWKDFFGNSYCQLWVTSLLLKNGWCFPLTTSPVRRASWECLRGLRPGTILGNWGARGALRTILESLLWCQPAPHWSWEQAACGCFPGQKWVLLERVPCEDVLSSAQTNHLKSRIILSQRRL